MPITTFSFIWGFQKLKSAHKSYSNYTVIFSEIWFCRKHCWNRCSLRVAIAYCSHVIFEVLRAINFICFGSMTVHTNVWNGKRQMWDDFTKLTEWENFLYSHAKFCHLCRLQIIFWYKTSFYNCEFLCTDYAVQGGSEFVAILPMAFSVLGIHESGIFKKKRWAKGYQVLT